MRYSKSQGGVRRIAVAVLLAYRANIGVADIRQSHAILAKVLQGPAAVRHHCSLQDPWQLLGGALTCSEPPNDCLLGYDGWGPWAQLTFSLVSAGMFSLE